MLDLQDTLTTAVAIARKAGDVLHKGWGNAGQVDFKGEVDLITGHFAHFIRRCQGVRRAGSAALDLCYVACGRLDGFWEKGLHTWDVAAGVLIVREAGGRISDFDGGPGYMSGAQIVASNGRIHAEMLDVLRLGEILE